jgi:CubicO group peptidase (beta-lactamase class C family)
MKAAISRIFFLLIFSIFFFNCSNKLNKQVDELFSSYNPQTPGAAIAVISDGEIIYKKGFGSANLEYDVPISPSTIFHIASISKQFTVFSILLLEKEGKLSIDDDIRKYIPEVPDFGHSITLRHLASHTSGLRDQWNLLALAGWRLDDVITKEHILKLVKAQRELNFIPGEEFLYCNTGFTLLAEVVARVSGMTFSAFTSKHIFRPLKMSNTLFYDDHEKIVSNRAYSFYTDSTGYKKSGLNFANVGATSLFTTVEDLSLWAINFSSPKVGDSKIFNKMDSLAVLNNGETFGGALGQFVGQYKGLKQIQHGGADAGYRSFFARFPDQDFAVAVLSNDAAFDAGGIAYKMVDIYLNDQLKEEIKKEPEIVKGLHIDPKILDTYLGAYELQPGIIISITLENGQLFGQGTGQAKFLMKPVSTTVFSLFEGEAKIEFFQENEGKAELFKLHQGGQVRDVYRTTPFDASKVDLKEYTGRFYSEELSTAYDFILEGNQLIARHSRLSDISLNPTKDNIFVGNKWFFGQVEFVQDSLNNITGCLVSSGRVKNLRFQKINLKEVNN